MYPKYVSYEGFACTRPSVCDVTGPGGRARWWWWLAINNRYRQHLTAEFGNDSKWWVMSFKMISLAWLGFLMSGMVLNQEYSTNLLASENLNIFHPILSEFRRLLFRLIWPSPIFLVLYCFPLVNEYFN